MSFPVNPDQSEPSIAQLVLPEKLQYLLSIYLSQNIVYPVELDFSQLAYRWVGGYSGKLVPISVALSVNLSDLQGIDKQKEKIIANTEQFLAGCPANHVLMTGTRGSGKSSLVRALLKQYHQYGLRIIEVSKGDLVVLDKIRDAIIELERIGYKQCRYIIYCDDLTFDTQDENYRTLKSILDGSLDSEQDKLLVYATSNRRHLLPQLMQDNVDIYNGQTDEVNPQEAIDETVSLSDRFGLWLSFQPMQQDVYLKIVEHYINLYSMSWTEELEAEALQWASTRGGRSGRVAYQFSRDYAGKNKLIQQGGLHKEQDVKPPPKKSLLQSLSDLNFGSLEEMLTKMAEKANDDSGKQIEELSNKQILTVAGIIAVFLTIVIVIMLLFMNK